MITCEYRNGRLGEVMYMTYGLFYFCIRNNINLNQIVLNRLYAGQKYFSNEKEHVINDNIEIFGNIKNQIVNNIDDIFQKYEMIDQHMSMFKNSDVQYDYAKNYVLKNYWHFPIYTRLFKALFKNDNVIKSIKSKYKYDFDKCCSIHIRRGDFVDIENNTNMKLKYPNKIPMKSDAILEKMKNIKTCNDDIKFLVFSDDIKWCKKNIKNNSFDVEFIDGNKPYFDMTMISLCKQNIISEGSYFSYCAMLLK